MVKENLKVNQNKSSTCPSKNMNPLLKKIDTETPKPLYTPVKFRLTQIIDCKGMGTENILGNNFYQNSSLIKEFDYDFHNLENFEIEDLNWKEVRPIGAGIKNVANNCYASSILQILYYCPFFINMLEKIEIDTNENEDQTLETHSEIKKPDNNTLSNIPKTKKNNHMINFNILTYLQKHMKGAQKSNLLTPTSLIKNLGLINNRFEIKNENFKNSQGQDASIFLKSQLLLCIKHYFSTDNAVSNKMKEICPLSSVFLGKLKKSINCPKCDHSLDSPDEAILDIPQNIVESNNLQDTVNNFFIDSTIKNFTCSNCNNKVDAKMTKNLSKFPAILSLYVRRFEAFTGKNNTDINRGVKKNMRKLNFNEKIYQRKQEESLFSGKENIDKKISYELIGIIQHKGDKITNGHYISIVKASNKMWFKADDDKVTQFSLNNIKKEDIFMLFYQICLDDQEKDMIEKSNETLEKFNYSNFIFSLKKIFLY